MERLEGWVFRWSDFHPHPFAPSVSDWSASISKRRCCRFPGLMSHRFRPRWSCGTTALAQPSINPTLAEGPRRAFVSCDRRNIAAQPISIMVTPLIV